MKMLTDKTKLIHEEMFVGGYFTDLMLAGIMPRYGYPKTKLPDVGDATMEIESGFMQCLKRNTTD